MDRFTESSRLRDDGQETSNLGGDALDWVRDGAALHKGAVSSLIENLRALAATQPQERAGVRLHGHLALSGLLTRGPILDVARGYLGPAARPVRAILFDKTPTTNWALGWHQDRTIAIRARADVDGYDPWSIKQGIVHVQPPFAVTAAMVTVRVHLDDVPADNAPLLIAPGSHRCGRVAEQEIDAIVARHGIIACLAEAGDVWAYATPILHASAAASGERRRRVLQVDYADTALPPGLDWLGI